MMIWLLVSNSLVTSRKQAVLKHHKYVSYKLLSLPAPSYSAWDIAGLYNIQVTGIHDKHIP